MTAKEFLEKYDNNYEFSEGELRELFWKGCSDNTELIDEENDENRRWSYMSYKYYKIQDRYFMFSADIGLTEMQDNSYEFQPEEVILTQEEKTIIINNWTIKEKNDEV